eukprot:g4984.t1
MLIANISPASSSYYETLSTLRFASRVKNLKSNPLKPIAVRSTLQIVEAKNKYLEARVKELEKKIVYLNSQMRTMRFCNVCGNDQSFNLSRRGDHETANTATKTTLSTALSTGYKLPSNGLKIFRRSLSEYDDEGNVISPTKKRPNALVTYDDL